MKKIEFKARDLKEVAELLLDPLVVVEQFRALFYPCVHFVERDASRSLHFIFITSFCVSSRSLGVLAIYWISGMVNNNLITSLLFSQGMVRVTKEVNIIFLSYTLSH